MVFPSPNNQECLFTRITIWVLSSLIVGKEGQAGRLARSDVALMPTERRLVAVRTFPLALNALLDTKAPIADDLRPVQDHLGTPFCRTRTSGGFRSIRLFPRCRMDRL